MTTRRLLVIGLLFSGFSAAAQASPIAVDFVRAEVPPSSTTTGLPYFMSGPTDIIFLKFKIPDIADIVAINSFALSVAVYDDADGGGEVGNVEFALPGGNLALFDFVRLNGFTAASPLILSGSLSALDIAQVLPSLGDGTFRIRVARDSGDFFLGGGSAIIDATLASESVTPVPEPSTVLIMASGLCAIAARFRAGKRSPRRFLSGGR